MDRTPMSSDYASPLDSGGGTGTNPDMISTAATDASASAATTLSSSTSDPPPETIPVYPIPVYLKFSPGGVSFGGVGRSSSGTGASSSKESHAASKDNNASPGEQEEQFMYDLADYSQAFSNIPITPSSSGMGGTLFRAPRNTATAARRTPSSSASSLTGAAEDEDWKTPDMLVYQAKLADDKLCSYIKLFAAAAGQSSSTASPPTYLPSLSTLANAVFGRLTGVPPATAKAWADAMILQYYDEDEDPLTWPSTEKDVLQQAPAPRKDTSGQTTVALLKRLLEEGQAKEESNSKKPFRPRPCGYVFKRGDIAWNCRTCQTDSTCVICDNCFRESNHDGHEVYFHRTTPGGCCDCGDAEAWKVDGCCDSHRPELHDTETIATVASEDPEEAVRMAVRGRQDGIDALQNPPTRLPAKVAAALGVVVGAAVHCLVQAVDGAGIGADPAQWKLRWADEAAKIWNGAPHQEDYHHTRNSLASKTPSYRWKTPNDFIADSHLHCKSLPSKYTLQLRLHNDDVHTFDDVIDALHEPRHSRRNQGSDDQLTESLVTLREAADQMTHHVDADGQVTVKNYSSIPSAMHGFKRLKSHGLHCAVVSTAQVDMEHRARALSSWLTEISAAHPAAAILVVDALLQVQSTHDLGGVAVWHEARSIPAWVAVGETDEVQACRRRFQAFPPHLASSYLTSEESELLYSLAMEVNKDAFVEFTATDPSFYGNVPYRLPSSKYRKSPHALWGTLPSLYTDPVPSSKKHPLLIFITTGQWNIESLMTRNSLTEMIYVVDTDLRKQQEADRIISSVFPHKLPGLFLISGVGTVRTNEIISSSWPPPPNPMEYRHLLATSSFRAPMSPVILLLLLDPYPTKQLRGAIHSLFLSLLTDARFKCRFAAALGIAYRPLSTLFCAGVGTEADTPLGFTVQIFTAGSLVRALGSAPAVEKLLLPDDEDSVQQESSIGVFTMPIALTVVRCIHTNLLGATKDVIMILKNTPSGNDNDSHENIQSANESLLPALTYVAGEHPLMTLLPAAPDDGFLDSRSTRHKRLPHLLRDLEYVIETPGTAMRLLLPNKFPAYQGIPISSRGEEILTFCTVWSRLLRSAQGMDPQKRKISGAHVEFEENRWLEAFGLSLNFAGTRDALAESPTNSSSVTLAPVSEDGTHLVTIREAMGNIIAALLREIKFWLYQEGMLETGLPVPSGGAHGTSDASRAEVLQRSTLHVTASQLGASSPSEGQSSPSNVSAVALSCATSVKMSEKQLDLIETALRFEGTQRQYKPCGLLKDAGLNSSGTAALTSGAVMGDWLRVPHSPLAGDSLSFHLPLHRALAKTVRSLCGVVVPESVRSDNSRNWWKLPVLDGSDTSPFNVGSVQHPLVPLIRPILRTSNCRVVWSAGPDCTPQEAQRRRARSRTVSANIAVAKIIHSLADHPIRCLAAAQQIERHLWARNGSPVAGMALNYSNAPLCRSFRDLDLTLVQLSAAGMSVGLGARRVFALLLSRFSMDGYLCDPERRSAPGTGGNGSFAGGFGMWINPPRLQDPDHATVLSESFFATMCIVVTELPPPPPISSSDETWLRQSIRRELIHALAAEPRSHSAAMSAASCAVARRDESDGSAGTSGGGGLFRDVFAQVLKEVGKRKNQGSRVGAGPASFELSPSCCDEYDPTFFHLRRQEHQHAMDVIASLRKQKLAKKRNEESGSDGYCFPLVCQPPRAHPRFLACRLMLHLPPMDAAIRRALLFALLGGSWLPPPDPVKQLDRSDDLSSPASADAALGISVSTDTTGGDVRVVTFSRRAMQGGGAGTNPFPTKRGSSFTEGDSGPPFSADIAAASSISFLEVLQLLTLQVHTLEECASLHRLQPDLDEEAKSLSSGLSINSYLGRLVRVPVSLADVWALRPYPDGPLKSKGSGEERGSILGLLIALYENRADHGAGPSGSQDEAADGHGGAKSLTASGLKWLLRFVNALVDGAPSVAAAVKSATTGLPIKQATPPRAATGEVPTIWTIDNTVRLKISGMLNNLPDLWPKPVDDSQEKDLSASQAKKERGKAAQQRMLEMMKMKQSAFVVSMGTQENGENKMESEQAEEDEDEELCIICRCDDADGENNGPLGYLGHVQRSRVAQMRACSEAISKGRDGVEDFSVFQRYRVVGHMGCQVRETEAMDSRPVHCLPRGSIVTVLKSTVSDKYDILSRRVLVKHLLEETGKVTEGWASVQSSQGYVILSPLVSLCYENTRWGSTRPIIRQCGHAAHLKCVETHTLSLHQRAAGEQPYDGRFAANIDDGEFLCPLCKQLSNILIPRDGCAASRTSDDKALASSNAKKEAAPNLEYLYRELLTPKSVWGGNLPERSEIGHKALADFGSHLLQAMAVPWERSSGSRKRKHRKWHASIQRWDYEEEDGDVPSSEAPTTVKGVLRLLRQQHIAWAAVGHSAAAAEAAVRGLEEILPFGSFSKTDEPWQGYKFGDDNNPQVQELSRIMTGTSGLLEVLIYEMFAQLGYDPAYSKDIPASVCLCLADILCGESWTLELADAFKGNIHPQRCHKLALWSEITALMSAMPCHVARDGMLSQRHEARATAAQMWVSRGLGTQYGANGEPPVPLAVDQVFADNTPRPPEMESNWGSVVPAEYFPGANPFRPAVATAFLYMPLLSWDLNSLGGAIFSSILVSKERLPDYKDILNCGRILLIGRMIQTLVTPHGFDSLDDMEIDEGDEEGRWDPTELATEAEALYKLYAHCTARVKDGNFDFDGNLKESSAAGLSSPISLFGSVGRSVLPLARSVILMMRACYHAVESRSRKKGASFDNSDHEWDPNFKILRFVLGGTETMTTNDGMFVLKVMGGPLPSSIINSSGEWWSLINRWLTATIGLEKHHGSNGKSILPELYSSSRSGEKGSDDLKMSFEESGPGHAEMDDIAIDQSTPPATSSTAKADQSASESSAISNNAYDSELGHDATVPRRFFADNIGQESDEELVDDMDDAEEMIDPVDQVIAGFEVEDTGNGDGEESADEPSTSGSDDGESNSNDVTHLFAGVGQSPIISYQPSLLAQQTIGPGKQGSMFESVAASSVMADFSHLGLIHRKDTPTFSLIRLPKSFVELYGIVNKVKGRDESTTLDEADDIGNSETAICLLTGAVMRSGSNRRTFARTQRPPGACTLHARKTGSGIGIFFLVQKCTVLLMHNNKSAYSASIYVDEHGEEDPGLRRGRPLFLNDARYRALEMLWRQQGIPREVAQIRSTSDRVIRDNWY
ncbi:zinc-finger UBR box domain containing protein [Nitzschia inconspicua]|uniref:E3 ubiquitin-protein ligase n=1 Tax=Nitzschia inconspicua TaxID=303405 RepID=A0A9K3PU19_9STRA|nr:zinc-finger UBR box domain containing protein [Nitzschia inconspicua]